MPNRSSHTPEHIPLKQWVERINSDDMPVFGQTAQELAKLAEDESSPPTALANVILRDPAMTARLLRLANSAYYSSSGQQFTTVSKAVLMLGFKTIRELCLSVVLVDTLLRGTPRKELHREMARAFYAAVLARTLAVKRRGQESPEEVFIAALLFRLGEMAFWCFAPTEGDRLEDLLHEEMSRSERRHAEVEVLGFHLSELTTALAKEWHLGDLLKVALSYQGENDPHTRGIVLSHDTAEVAGRGFETPEGQILVRELSEYAKISREDVLQILEVNASEASFIAKTYGAEETARLMPGTESPEGETAAEPTASDGPDPMLQLKLLRELAILVSTKPEFNSIVEHTLEGILRGIGMDRAVFLVFTPERTKLKAKFALGLDRSEVLDTFEFDLPAGAKTVFSQAIDKHQGIWVPKLTKGDSARVHPGAEKLIGDGAFFIIPLVVGGRAIGLLYADRLLTRRPLDTESFESFEHFAIQASQGLEISARQSHR